MPVFSYKAKKGPGEISEGRIEAENRENVISQLLERGLTPLKVEAVSFDIMPSVRQPVLRMPFGRIKHSDVDIFTRQIASLIKSSITLLRALHIIREQTENPAFKKIIANIEGDIERGEILSDALLKYPKIFPAIYINIVKSGEASGALDEALNRLIEFREKEEEIRAMIRAALTYPVFLISAGILTVFFMLTFFMPRLIDLFAQLGQTLPLPTRILIAISNFSKSNWVWILIGFSVPALLFKRKNTSKNEKFIIDWFKLRLPVVGGLIRKSETSKFARALAILIKSGIPIIKAIDVAIPLINSETFRGELINMNRQVVDGSSLAEGMKNVSQFSPMVLNIVAVGEEGGRLEEALMEVAAFYEKEVDRTIKMAASLIEPLIIIVIGAVVGFIVFAMLLPIFSIDMAAR